MVDLGSELREAREAQGISLTEAEAATRIKERYLKALEANDWAALPTHVQARGFMRNYAVYLGLDEEDVMSKFSQATRTAEVSLPVPPAADSPVPTTSADGAVFRPRDISIDHARVLPAWLASDVVIGIALAIVVAVIGFGLLRLVLSSAGETSNTANAGPDLSPGVTQVATTPTAGVEMSPGQAGSMAVTPTFDASTGGVQLDLEATEHVWVRVTVDGAQVLEGVLVPESPQTWRGTQQIILETANGAGLKAVVNGQPQGALGDRGQVVILAWGPNGQLSLTPPPSP
jgi:cytoskeleton protein RodZ